MRIFFVSDTHGKRPPNPGRDVDMIVHGGDFYNCMITKGKKVRPLSRKSNDMRDLKNYAEDMAKSGVPFFAVRGNHDVGDPAGLFGRFDLTGKVEKLASGIFLVGLGWSGDRYFDLPNIPTMSGVCVRLLDECMDVMTDGDQCILVSHYVASGSNQEQMPGWIYDSIAEVVWALRPLVVLQGHSHQLFGRRWEIDGVHYAVPGPEGAIIDADPERQVVRIFR